MCTDCIPNWEPPRPGEGETFYPEDSRPTYGTLDDLSNALATLPNHQPWNCPVTTYKCSECSAYYRRERFQQDSRDEERYDAERWAS